MLKTLYLFSEEVVLGREHYFTSRQVGQLLLVEGKVRTVFVLVGGLNDALAETVVKGVGFLGLEGSVIADEALLGKMLFDDG